MDINVPTPSKKDSASKQIYFYIEFIRTLVPEMNFPSDPNTMEVLIQNIENTEFKLSRYTKDIWFAFHTTCLRITSIILDKRSDLLAKNRKEPKEMDPIDWVLSEIKFSGSSASTLRSMLIYDEKVVQPFVTSHIPKTVKLTADVETATSTSSVDKPATTEDKAIAELKEIFQNMHNKSTNQQITAEQFFTKDEEIQNKLIELSKMSSLELAYQAFYTMIVAMACNHQYFVRLRYQACLLIQTLAVQLITSKELDRPTIEAQFTKLFMCIVLSYENNGGSNPIWKWFFTDSTLTYNGNYTRLQIFECAVRKSRTTLFDWIRAVYAKLAVSFNETKSADDLISLLSQARDIDRQGKKGQQSTKETGLEKATKIENAMRNLTSDIRGAHEIILDTLNLTSKPDDIFNIGLTDEDLTVLLSYLSMMYPGLVTPSFETQVESTLRKVENNPGVRIQNPTTEYSASPSRAFHLFNLFFQKLQEFFNNKNVNRLYGVPQNIFEQIERPFVALPPQLIVSLLVFMANKTINMEPSMKGSNLHPFSALKNMIFPGVQLLKLNETVTDLLSITPSLIKERKLACKIVYRPSATASEREIDIKCCREWQFNTYIALTANNSSACKRIDMRKQPRTNPFSKNTVKLITSVPSVVSNPWNKNTTVAPTSAGTWAQEMESKAEPSKKNERVEKAEPVATKSDDLQEIVRLVMEKRKKWKPTAEDQHRSEKLKAQREKDAKDPRIAYQTIKDYLEKNGITEEEFLGIGRTLACSTDDEAEQIQDDITESIVSTEFNIEEKRRELLVKNVQDRFLMRFETNSEENIKALDTICKIFKFSNHSELREWITEHRAVVPEAPKKTKGKSKESISDLIKDNFGEKAAPVMPAPSMIKTVLTQKKMSTTEDRSVDLTKRRKATTTDLLKALSNAKSQVVVEIRSEIFDKIGILKASDASVLKPIIEFIRAIGELKPSDAEKQIIKSQISESIMALIDLSLPVLEETQNLIKRLDSEDDLVDSLKMIINWKGVVKNNEILAKFFGLNAPYAMSSIAFLQFIVRWLEHYYENGVNFCNTDYLYTVLALQQELVEMKLTPAQIDLTMLEERCDIVTDYVMDLERIDIADHEEWIRVMFILIFNKMILKNPSYTFTTFLGDCETFFRGEYLDNDQLNEHLSSLEEMIPKNLRFTITASDQVVYKRGSREVVFEKNPVTVTRIYNKMPLIWQSLEFLGSLNESHIASQIELPEVKENNVSEGIEKITESILKFCTMETVNKFLRGEEVASEINFKLQLIFRLVPGCWSYLFRAFVLLPSYLFSVHSKLFFIVRSVSSVSDVIEKIHSTLDGLVCSKDIFPLVAAPAVSVMENFDIDFS